MSIPTVALNEASPAGTGYIRAGDDRIREYKLQVREILEVDHNFQSSGQDAAAGRHKQMTLDEAADIGSGASAVTILGAQLVGSKPELTYTDEDDIDVQITHLGKIALDKGRLPNDTYMIGRNNADDGDINILKVNTSDVPLFGVMPLTPSAAPTADYEVANKKYVDDQVATTTDASLLTSGTLPGARLDSYDSGWFAVGATTTYTKTHNLGTTKVLPLIFTAENSDGTGWCLLNMGGSGYLGERQCMMVTLSTTQIQLRSGVNVVDFTDAGGTRRTLTSGYARIVMIALE